MARPKKRKLPSIPDDMDVTDPGVIRYLLEEWAWGTFEIPEWDLENETDVFFTLVAVEYPAALKAYTDREIHDHLKMMLRSEVIDLRRQSRRRLSIERAREKARKRAEKKGEEYDDSEDEEIPSVFRSSSAIGNSGSYRQVAAMTRLDLTAISHRYRSTAASSLNAASFHDKLAERLLTDEEKVEDRWSEDEVDALADEFWGNEEEEDDE